MPANTIAEFIAYAKARPGKLLFAANGQGSTSHMCTELFRTLAGIKMVWEHAALGGGSRAVHPPAFIARLQAETAKWSKLLKDANIRPAE